MTTLPPQEVNLFRSIRETAIVLIIMFRLDRPAGETELSNILGVTRKTARRYLNNLSMAGLVTRMEYHKGWSLTHLGRQMALPLDAPFLIDAEFNSHKPVDNLPESVDNFGEISDGGSDQLGSTLPSSSESDDQLGSTLPSSPNVVVKTLNLIKRSLTTTRTDQLGSTLPSSSADLWKTLQDAGVQGSVRDELAAHPHLTPELVEKWHQHLTARDGSAYNRGLLVSILRQVQEGDQPPPVPVDPSNYRRYIQGDLSDLIEH